MCLIMEYGTKLKKLVKDSGLTLQEISEGISVPPSTIVGWYKTIYPPLEQIVKMCNFFKIELWEFFLDNPAKLNKYMPDYIKAEDAAILKILNTSVDVKTRVEVKKLFVQAMKLILLQNAAKYRHMPEFQALFPDYEYQEQEEKLHSKIADK